MSANENHPIEKELQREAARRRAELGDRDFELSAGARNTLQAEVDRTYQRPDPVPARRGSWLGSVWTKLAFAGVGVVLLVLGLQLAERASPTSGPGDLARLDEGVAPSPTGGTRDESELSTMEVGEPAESLLSKTEQLGRAVAEIPAPATDSLELGAAFNEPRRSRALEDSSAAETARSAPAPEPTAAAPRRLAAESRGLEFRQPAPRAAPPATSRPFTSAGANSGDVEVPSQSRSQVMQRFQLQVAGDQIVFIDDDGSRYSGSLQQQVADGADQEALTTSSPSVSVERYGASTAVSSRHGRAAGAATQALVQQGLFTAEGTNLTVRQNVKLTGRFYVQGVETNALQQDYMQRYGDLFQSVGNVLVLTGKAVVGETNEVPIHAETPTGN